MFHYMEFKLFILKALSPLSEFIAVAMNNIIAIWLSTANKIRICIYVFLSDVRSRHPGVLDSFSELCEYPSLCHVS